MYSLIGKGYAYRVAFNNALKAALPCVRIKARFEPAANTGESNVKTTLLSRGTKCRTYCTGFAIKRVNSAHDTSTLRCHGDNSDRMLHVTWPDRGHSEIFPYLWLRDSCQCDACRHPHNESRLFQLEALDLDISVREVQVDDRLHTVTVKWSDNHVSIYPSSWLAGRSFTEDAQRKRLEWYTLPKTLWTARDLEGRLPCFNYQDVMGDDTALYGWLVAVERLGICLLDGAPLHTTAVSRLGERVAHLRTTNYGPQFSVLSKVEASSSAYTASTLGLHTDLSFFKHVPGMQMLHCIKQADTEGGDNQFSDGFFVAERLRAECPDVFRTLVSVPVDVTDAGSDHYKFHLINRRSTIALDATGEVECVAFGNSGRDTFLTVPLRQVVPLYRALKMWHDCLVANQVEFKLQPGEVICFDNTRLLHGRSGFSMAAGTERHLEGGYIDWDELRGCRRYLQTRLGHPSAS